ncbi:MAG: calcium-binding protein, partial [Actinomycetota bacterium]
MTCDRVGRGSRRRRSSSSLVAVAIGLPVLVVGPQFRGGDVEAAGESCLGAPATIVGTSGADVLTGTEGDDVIVGLDGADTIDGLGGDDVICGGNGDDAIKGGDGNDTIDGGNGSDTIDGQGGDDDLTGFNGNDVINGGPGNDRIDGGNGSDVLDGGNSNDTVDGFNGNDSCDDPEVATSCETITFDGEDEPDPDPDDTPLCGGRVPSIVGTVGADTIVGTHGVDVVWADDGDDVINTLSGDDVICAGNGDDRVEAGNGNDVVEGGSGADWVNTGNGNDEVFAGGGDDAVIGFNGNDSLYGGAGNDALDGGNGRDQLIGGSGDDDLIGFNGNDDLYGNEGDDTADGGFGSDDCFGVENQTRCSAQADPAELVGPSPNDIPAPPAGVVEATTAVDGVEVAVSSTGGISAADVQVTWAPEFAAAPVRDVLASAVYDFTLTGAETEFDSADITIPFSAEALDGFDPTDLRIYNYDLDAQLWVPVPGTQTVDVSNQTVTATVEHFSFYGVLKIRDADDWLDIYTDINTCLTEPVGIDFAYVNNGTFSITDPNDVRTDATVDFVRSLPQAR